MRPLLRPLAVALAAAALTLTGAGPAAASGSDPLAGTTVVGRLVQAWPESADDDGRAAAPLSWVQPASGDAVRVDTADLADVPAGSTVRVQVGAAVPDAGSDAGLDTAHSVSDTTVLTRATTGSTSAAPTSAAPPAAGLTDQVSVVLVLPPGAVPDGTTAPQLAAAVDGPVARFWSEQTRGAVRLGVTATHDWVRTTHGCGDPTALWAEAAAAAGFTAGPGRHLLVYVSSRPGDLAGCSYGLAQVGTGLHGGGDLYVRDTLPTLIAHELGHNFGLGHSSGRQCDGTVDRAGAADPACRTAPYRDYYDVMGASWEQVGTLTVAQEALLGVLPADQRRTLDAAGPGGTVPLAPLGGTGGTRGLELTAGSATYWLEYRAATGQDAWLGTAADRVGLPAGVLLHRAGTLPDTSLLLDGTPSPRSGWDADLQETLPTGTAVQLPGGFTVTVRSVGASGATIAVTTTPAAQASAAPARGSTSSRPGTLPAHPSATPSAAPTGTVAPDPVPVARATASGAPVRTRPAALVSSSAAGLLAGGCAVAGVALLIGGTLVRRRALRGRDRG